MKKALLIIVVLLVLVGGYFWTAYNGLVTKSEMIDSQWSQVEVQYQRRFDLIPNLVESAKGVMKQEQAVFTALAEARTRYAGATTVNDKAAAATQVEAGLGFLLGICGMPAR
jgi:LemA protein